MLQFYLAVCAKKVPETPAVFFLLASELAGHTLMTYSPPPHPFAASRKGAQPVAAKKNTPLVGQIELVKSTPHLALVS